ncbi:MAG: hypothetical protein VR64_17870 [Desulfatitalea sp. BRH_c12]|nr:MAG: hypothetical protein VR64_17870 [Desulfatitalea sp. BRH_c12]
MAKKTKVTSITPQDREKALMAERRTILALPPEKALDAILDHPYPVTLVQSMAEEDLYLLVHTIGPEDALPILGMASNQQWEYFVDMEAWRGDRIDPHAMTQWLDRLLKADPDRFTHWIVTEQREAFEDYLFRNIDVHVREYEQDPSEVAEGFQSEDDVHYVRMRPYPPTSENAVQRQELRDQFLTDVLRRLSVFDFRLYQELLLGSTAILPSENEEELLRLRNVRLAEKGFLPFEEAVGVYQPLKVADLLKRSRKSAHTTGRAVDTYPLRVDAADPPENANLFMQTLARLQDDIALQRLQAEFAGLCNQIIAADQIAVRDKDTLARVVDKAGGYISIGLEKVKKVSDGDAYHSANLIQSYLLSDIFRVGYGCALQLKWQADRWRHASWFARAGLPLAFWGEAWLGVLGGLLIKKPLLFDNYATGVLYREFATLADVEATARVLDKIVAVDDLFARMGVTVTHPETDTYVTCQNVLLTLWANHCLGMDADPTRPEPLTRDAFRTFFEKLWVRAEKARRIKDEMREGFLAWLSERSGQPTFEIADRIGPALEELFAQIESEMAAVSPDDLDPRYIQLFLMRGGESV